MTETDSPDPYMNKADDLIQQAEAAMPYYESDKDWTAFNRLITELKTVPYTYVFLIAGPDVNKKDLGENIEVALWSVKGNQYRQFYEYMYKRYGSILTDREMRAAACLLENIHQHVRQGLGLCVIRVVLGKYKQITVSDNGDGFYNYKKKKRLAVKDAIRFGRAYGSRYKSQGQALATSFGLWSDVATIETPHDSVIIVPEGIFRKILRGLSRILPALIIALGADLVLLLIRENASILDLFVILSVFGIVIARDRILSFFGREAEKKYFPQVKFRVKNTREFGSSLSVYFCSAGNKKNWRKGIIERLKRRLKDRCNP